MISTEAAEGRRYNGCAVATIAEGESGDESGQMNSPPDKVTPRCEVFSSPKQTREVLETFERAEQVALDVQAEDRGAVGAALAGVSFCFEPGAAYHALLGSEETDDEGMLQELRPLLGADGLPKVMHDAKPGLMVLAQRGVETGTPAFDTLLAAFLLDGKAHDLEDLIADRLGLSAEKGAVRGSEERTRNACARVEAVLRLSGLLEAELEERGQLAYLRKLELQLVPVLVDMELVGVAVDAAALEELAASVGGDREFVLQLIEAYHSDSAAQIRAVEEAVAAGDAAALVRPAHTLKSSSATLGAERVSVQARALERAGRSGSLDEEARTVAASLRRDWEATMAALRAWTEAGTAR